MILILTQPDDPHAAATYLALKQKGVASHVWYTSDFPSHCPETLRFSADTHNFCSTSLPDDLNAITAVWNRRPAHVLDEENLHPADREFVELNCRLFRKGCFDLLYQDAFWINPHEAVRRDTKVTQLAHAQRVGFSIPETVITNDPEEIRSFLRQEGSAVVYKPLSSLPWKDQETYWMPYTAELTEDDLIADRLLQAAPGIYQAIVPKQHELRVTVMGQTILAAKILSQETRAGRQDWRKAYAELQMEAVTLPPEIERQCIALLQRMGYVFGCFDFIVTPAGDCIFLEVNQMGQFLFLEAYTDLPLLDVFTDFLASGVAEFRWQETSTALRYEDLKPAVEDYLAEARAHHTLVPEQHWVEDVSEET